MALPAGKNGKRVRNGGSHRGLSPVEVALVEFFVSLADMAGMPKSVGEIYGLLFASEDTLAMDEIIARLNREIITILRSSETRDKLASQGAEVSGSTSAEFARLMQSDIAKWAQVTARLKIQPQ